MTMPSWIDYARENGETPERWPNLKEASAKAYMGQTAILANRPFLITGFDGELYDLEGEKGEQMRVNRFVVRGYHSDNNRMVAASRISGSPLGRGMKLAACNCTVEDLDYDPETGEWTALSDAGKPIDLKELVEALEDADWKVDDTIAVEDDTPKSSAFSEERFDGYVCPECGSENWDMDKQGAYCGDCAWEGYSDDVLSSTDEMDNNDNDWQVEAAEEKFGVIVTDSNGDELQPGRYYNLHGDKYKIPDVIKVMEIDDNGHVVAKVDDNPHPLQITAKDIEDEGYSFEPLPIASNIESHFFGYKEAAPITYLGDPEQEQYKRNRPMLPERPPMGMNDDEVSWRTEMLTQLGISPESAERMAQNPGIDWHTVEFLIKEKGAPPEMVEGILASVQDSSDEAVVEEALEKVARRQFTLKEQQELIKEEGTARNKHKLKLDGTHYTETNSEDDEFLW